MKDFEIIRSADQMRSLARDQRLEILQHLVGQPLTVTMVAERMGRPVNQVHYHLRHLASQSLVVEVVDPKRTGKRERYYRAAARHFLVDPSLTGPDESISQSVRNSLEISSLHRRQRETLEFDLGRIARRVVVDCLGVTPDQRVLVMVAPTALELGEALLVELQAAGAETRTKVWSRGVILQTLDRHTPESLSALPFIHPGQDRDLDAMILVACSIPQGGAPTPEQREKLPLLMEAVSAWQRSLRDRGVRTLEIALPHRGEFDGGWNSPEESIDIYWRCFDVAGETLQSTGARLRHGLDAASRWTISDARGTALEFEMEPGSLRVSDGLFGAGEATGGLPDEVLPAGQLKCVPDARTASGSIWADYTWIGGRHFYDVRLVIHHGRIVEARAKDDSESLVAAIRAESGDPDLLAGTGIGLNPGGRVLTGRPSLDAILAGVVTISFGNNELDGGSVRSTLTLNLPSRSMTVTVGEKTLVAGGILNTGS